MQLIKSIGTPSNKKVLGIRGYQEILRYKSAISNGMNSFTLAQDGGSTGTTGIYNLAFGNNGYKLYFIRSGDYVRPYTLTDAYDTTTMSYDGTELNVASNDVGQQESTAESITLSPDGKLLFVGGFDKNSVLTYTLSTAWDVTTASPGYYLKGIRDWESIGSESDTNRRGFTFGDSGNKLYAIGYSSDRLEQFTLSTAYDVTTYSSDGALDLANSPYSITGPVSIRWKPDGTKFYVCGITNDDVNEFSVSTAWDVTSTVTELNEFYVGTYENTPYDIAFNSDGTKMFILGIGGDDITEYSLSTGYDTTTASYSSTTNVSITDPMGFDFSPDGTKLVVLGNSADTLYYYTLSTAFDLSTLSSSSSTHISAIEYGYANGVVSPRVIYPTAVRYSNDGSTLTVIDIQSTSERLIQYTLMEDYNVNTLVYGALDLDASPGFSDSPTSCAFNPDGTKFYVFDSTDKTIDQYSLTYPYVLSHQSEFSTFDGTTATLMSGVDTTPRGFCFDPTGSILFLSGTTTDSIAVYSLSTPFDVTSTITLINYIDTSSWESSPRDLVCHYNGEGRLRLFMTGDGSNKVWYHDLLN